MILYGYWRSSASYRVRLALHYKGIEFDYRSVHLVNNGGEQHSEGFKRLNPAGLVPCLVDGELTLNQSLAIIDYLESIDADSPSLLPDEPRLRARILAFAHDLAMDLQPITNLRILQAIDNPAQGMNGDKLAWISRWVHETFAALELRVSEHGGLFCFGDSFTLADLCLLPQYYNAKRFGVSMKAYPKLMSICEHAVSLPFVQKAYPDNQPDAQ